MKTTTLISFTKEQIPNLLRISGKEKNSEGYIADVKTKEVIKCFECEKDLKIEQLGNIMPGTSDVFLCDNLACFAKYVNERGLI